MDGRSGGVRRGAPRRSLGLSLAITEGDVRLLVEAHQSGDARAFEEIARLTYPTLYHQARRRLGSHHAAEDAVQETLARAFRALPRFEGDFRLQAWLHRILVNVCNDEGSRRIRETSVVQRIGSMAEDSEIDPAELSVLAAERAVVAGALAELPAPYRTAVALRYLDDLSYRDVAAATGVSEENARARASRGRAVLQRVLGRGMSGLIAVFPGLRRTQRTPALIDPTLASSATSVDHVSQAIVVSGGGGPLGNLSAQVVTQVVQAAPVITRLAEVSTTMAPARSTAMAGLVGAISAVVVPTAYTALENRPPSPPTEVVSNDVSALDQPALGSATTTTMLIAGAVVVPASSFLAAPAAPAVTAPPAPEPHAPRKLTSALPLAPAPADGEPALPAAEPEVPAAPPTSGRQAGIVSDALTVERDGSRLSMSGAIGFATADKDADPTAGQVGQIWGRVDLGELLDDGTRWARAVLQVEIDGRVRDLRMTGWLTEVTGGDGGVTYELSGSYRLEDAADLGLEERGDARWSLTLTPPSTEGDRDTERPLSSLRISLGDQPDPVEGDAPAPEGA